MLQPEKWVNVITPWVEGDDGVSLEVVIGTISMGLRRSDAKSPKTGISAGF